MPSMRGMIAWAWVSSQRRAWSFGMRRKASSNSVSGSARQGQPERAVADCDKALELDPDLAQAYYNKACAYGLQGKGVETVKWLREALVREREKYCELAKTDSDFDRVRDDPAFPALLAEFDC